MAQIVSTLRFLLKRTIHHRAILTPVVLGVLAATTILCSVPLFAAAAADSGLQASLRNSPFPVSRNLRIDFTSPALDADTYNQATNSLTANARYFLGSDLVRQAPLRTGIAQRFVGYHPGEPHQRGSGRLGSSFNLWFLNSMDPAHIQLTQGIFPSGIVTSSQTAEGTAYEVEALLSPEWAEELHLKLNDVVELTDGTNHPTAFLRVHFVGFFQARDENDPAWFGSFEPFTPPIAFGDDPLPPAPVWLNEQAFEQALPQLGLTQLINYSWSYYLNLTLISAGSAESVLANLDALKVHLDLANQQNGHETIAYVALSGLDTLLASFLQRRFFVTIATLAIILPGLALLLLYLWLAARALIDQSREEMVLMKSRGANRWQVFLLPASEAILLCGVAFLVAPLLAGQVTSLLTSFSFFQGSLGHSASLLRTPTLESYLYAGAAALLCLVVLILPALLETGTNLLKLKRQLSRPRRLPLWLRLAPGLLLATLGGAGFIELRLRGALFNQDSQGHVSIDWLTAAAPTLLLLGAAGLGLLLLPVLLGLLERLGRRLSSISFGLATRQMERRPAPYNRLVLLVSLTLSLGVMTAVFSATFVSNYQERAAYISGADLRLVEGRDLAPDTERQAAPLADHLAFLPGVTDGMNIFRSFGYVSSTLLHFPRVSTLAIDSTKFQQLAYWRSDFADQPIATLLHQLQQPVKEEDALPALVDDRLLADLGTKLGDNVDVQLGDTTNANFIIVGTYHYFPTQDTGRYSVVCDVNRLMQVVHHGNPGNHSAPNEVWLHLRPDAPHYSAPQIEQWMLHNAQHRQVIVSVLAVFDRRELASSLRNDPLHYAISAALSLDFVIAALLSVVGLVTFFYLIARQRAFEFGILRAMGLSLRQLALALGWEQVILLTSSCVLGILAGIVITRAVLPALATDDNGFRLLPPLAAQFTLQPLVQLGIFIAACLLAALAASVMIFRRLKVHEVLRLGEE